MSNFLKFFSNNQLLQYLYLERPGTVWIDFRKSPFSTDAEIKEKVLGTAEEILSNDGEVIHMKWFDNESAKMTSNFMRVGNTEVFCPEVVKNYNLRVNKMNF